MTDLWERAWAERPRLLRIARRRSLNAAEADDVVQDAIVRCVTHRATNPDRLAGMLTAVTMRLCVDRLRARTRAENAAPRLAAGPAPDLLEDVLDRAEAVWLAARVARLAPQEREAVVARAAGLTIAETADALGVSYRAVEGALYRARRKLIAAWAKTLVVAGWLGRRVRPLLVVAPLYGAVTAAVLVLPGDRRLPETQRAVAAVYEPTAARPAVRVRTVRPAGRSPLRAALVAPVVPSPTVVRVGPVEHEPLWVRLDTEEPLTDRLRRCAEQGVDVQVSAQHVAIVCRGES